MPHLWAVVKTDPALFRHRLAEGKVAETRQLWNLMGLMRQLGALPAPG